MLSSCDPMRAVTSNKKLASGRIAVRSHFLRSHRVAPHLFAILTSEAVWVIIYLCRLVFTSVNLNAQPKFTKKNQESTTQPHFFFNEIFFTNPFSLVRFYNFKSRGFGSGKSFKESTKVNSLNLEKNTILLLNFIEDTVFVKNISSKNKWRSAAYLPRNGFLPPNHFYVCFIEYRKFFRNLAISSF